MKTKYYQPSKEIEKKTHSMNDLLWGFVLLGIFIVWIVCFVIETMITGICGLSYTFIQDHTISIVVVPTIAVIASVILARIYLQQYLISYKFEEGKIIRGKIKDIPNLRAADAVIEGASLGYSAANIGSISDMQLGHAAYSTHRYSRLRSLNADPAFVSQYFDTDIYKKKTYKDPVLVKETPRFLIFSCANSRELKIRKIYEMPQIKRYADKNSGISARIAKRIGICAVVIFCIFVLDLSSGFANNKKYSSNADEAYAAIEETLVAYGFSGENGVYEKETEYNEELRTSELRYSVNKNGEITDVSVELYYSETSEDVDEELTAIIGTLGFSFTDDEISSFIGSVLECIDTDTMPNGYKLESDEGDILRIGLSGGFVQIKDY